MSIVEGENIALFRDLTLYNNYGTSFELYQSTSGVIITNDIFSFNMGVEVNIIATYDIITAWQIEGGEKLELSFSLVNDDEEEFEKRDFYVYNIEKVNINTKDKKRTYKLYLATKLYYFNNIQSLYSKTFKEKTAEDILKFIFNKADINTNLLHIESNIFKEKKFTFTTNFWNSYKIIQYIFANIDTEIPLFFETYEGYFLTTLNEVIQKNDVNIDDVVLGEVGSFNQLADSRSLRNVQQSFFDLTYLNNNNVIGHLTYHTKPLEYKYIFTEHKLTEDLKNYFPILNEDNKVIHNNIENTQNNIILDYYNESRQYWKKYFYYQSKYNNILTTAPGKPSRTVGTLINYKGFNPDIVYNDEYDNVYNGKYIITRTIDKIYIKNDSALVHEQNYWFSTNSRSNG